VHGMDDANNADTHGKRASTFVGTAEYIAPEVLEGGVLTQAVDFWGWACVLFQMLVGKPPFRGETEYLTFQKTINCEMRDMPHDMDANARDLILKVLVKETDQRLGAGDTGHDDLRAHPFFHGVDWDHVFDQQVRRRFSCRLLRRTRLALGSSALLLLCPSFRSVALRTDFVSLLCVIAGAYHRASAGRGRADGGKRGRWERRGSGGCPQARWVGFHRAQPRGGAVACRHGE
jgi:serine/threonine protein kinase